MPKLDLSGVHLITVHTSWTDFGWYKVRFRKQFFRYRWHTSAALNCGPLIYMLIPGTPYLLNNPVQVCGCSWPWNPQVLRSNGLSNMARITLPRFSPISLTIPRRQGRLALLLLIVIHSESELLMVFLECWSPAWADAREWGHLCWRKTFSISSCSL